MSVNFHIWKPCNDACKFCFATFGDVPGQLTAEDAVRVVRLLREAGCEAIDTVPTKLIVGPGACVA